MTMKRKRKGRLSALSAVSTLALTLAPAAGLLARPASALDTLSLPVEETAAGECPRLTQIKYPWIACDTTASGAKILRTPRGDQTYQSERRMPSWSDFVDGLGYFGPHNLGPGF
jgi:hypothetical protein